MQIAHEHLAWAAGGISVDLEGELVFISDTSQNRIIVMNAEGKVLDQVSDQDWSLHLFKCMVYVKHEFGICLPKKSSSGLVLNLSF